MLVWVLEGLGLVVLVETEKKRAVFVQDKHSLPHTGVLLIS